MRSKATSSSSAAICASAVLMPCPSSTLPLAIHTVRSRSKRICGCFIGCISFAARSTARTTRLCTPQRQRFRSSASRTCCSEGSRVLGNKGCGGDRDAADAVAALPGLLGEERLLDGMKLAFPAQTFDGGDALLLDAPERRVAGGQRLAVDDHEAGPALPGAAAEAAADEPEIVPQHVEERRVGRRRDAVPPAVDFEFRHSSTRWIRARRCRASASPRCNAAGRSAARSHLLPVAAVGLGELRILGPRRDARACEPAASSPPRHRG